MTKVVGYGHFEPEVVEDLQCELTHLGFDIDYAVVRFGLLF